jgi:hypothetical protein
MKHSRTWLVSICLAGGVWFTHGASAATLTAASCAQSAVQASINAAASGDIVVVPDGSCTWTSGVSISGKAIHLRGQTKGNVNITHSAGSNDLISVTTVAARSTEISNFNFLPGSGSGDAEYVQVSGSGRPALVHDNYFRPAEFQINCIRWAAIGGVIWNNVFEALERNGSSAGCLQLKAEGQVTSWTTASTMGATDLNGTANVYIENNTFKKIILQAIDVDDNMRVVIRYNTFDNSGFVYHGADTSPSGARHVEVYNNKFIFSQSGAGYNFPLNINWWTYVRGGTGIFTDNEMPDIQSQMWGTKSKIQLTIQNLRRKAGSYACWKVYPAPHQVGQSHNGSTAVTDPMYIWNNTGSASQNPSLDDYDPDECGTGARVADFVKAGRDFVVGAAKPGYTKYAYPHPLTTGAVVVVPPAPTGLTVR